MSEVDDPSRDGVVIESGGRATITFRRRLRHPPERVWSALTDPRELVGWYLTKGRIEGREGGRVELVTGPTKVRATGRVLTWRPPRRFDHEWHVDPRPDLPEGERSIVRWELEPIPGGTALTLTIEGLHPATAQVFLGGMHAFLDRLDAQLAGLPLGSWMEEVTALRHRYPAWGSSAS